MYNSFIYPYLTYCIEVWGTAMDRYLHPLEILQKRAVRLINCSPYLEHTQPIFKKLNLLKIKDLHTYKVGLLMYKVHYHIIPRTISDLFTPNSTIHRHNTRTAALLHVSGGKTESARRAIRVKGVDIWNKLAPVIKHDVPISTFKSLLKSYLL